MTGGHKSSSSCLHEVGPESGGQEQQLLGMCSRQPDHATPAGQDAFDRLLASMLLELSPQCCNSSAIVTAGQDLAPTCTNGPVVNGMTAAGHRLGQPI